MWCLALLSLAPDVRADAYVGADLITSRDNNDAYPGVTYHEWVYKGPRVFVQGQSINRDTYQCAPWGGQNANNWVAVADDTETSGLSFTSTGTSNVSDSRQYYAVITWNWSDTTAHIRVMTSCTDHSGVFPTTASYGDYLSRWTASLWAGKPDFVCLVNNAFKWGGCGGYPAQQRSFRAVAPPLVELTQVARPEGNTFALVNGSNSLDLIFRQPRGSLRPPAIYYSTTPANAGCAARRMGVPVNDGFGSVHLVLRCSGLRPGATAKLRIGPSIKRTFRLSKGTGSGRVHLDKPPGRVRPLVYVGTRPATAPCTVRSRRTHMARRTVDLRITGHCDRVTHGTRGELFVGGLLAEDPQ